MDEQAEVTRALAELVDLLELHFHTEELLMGRASFPEEHAHRLLHQACLQQVRGVLGELELGSRRSLAELRELVQVWIQDHVERQDQRFEAYLKQSAQPENHARRADLATPGIPPQDRR